jgi:LPXTG-motif cell wall-anchored protein
MTELPRTGAEHTKLGLLALALGLAALGARRLRRDVRP